VGCSVTCHFLKVHLHQTFYATCLCLIRIPPLRLDPDQEATTHYGRLAGRARLGSAACLAALLACDVVSLSLLSLLLDTTDKPMHETACLIHQRRVLRVIERAEGESPLDLAPISSV